MGRFKKDVFKRRFMVSIEKLFIIVLTGLSIVSYIKGIQLLNITTALFMSCFSADILRRSKERKIKIETQNLLDGESNNKSINIVPVYFLSFLFLFLAYLIISKTFTFSPTNNLIVSLCIAAYMYYKNEEFNRRQKRHEAFIKEYIDTHGEEKFYKYMEDGERRDKEFEQEFKKELDDIFKGK